MKHDAVDGGALRGAAQAADRHIGETAHRRNEGRVSADMASLLRAIIEEAVIPELVAQHRAADRHSHESEPHAPGPADVGPRHTVRRAMHGDRHGNGHAATVRI